MGDDKIYLIIGSFAVGYVLLVVMFVTTMCLIPWLEEGTINIGKLMGPYILLSFLVGVIHYFKGPRL